MSASPDPDPTLTQAYDELRAAWAKDGGLPVVERKAALRRLRAAIRDRAEDFAKTIDADFGGRSRHETLVAEILTILGAIDHALPRLHRWARPERVNVGARFWPASGRLLKQPKGVVGILGPSNFPVQLTVMPLIGALSAGCRILVKPSELVPRTASLLARCFAETFADNHVITIEGGPPVAAAMSALPLDHLLFTGSTDNGKRVLAAAAPNLTPVTLELGGKSPAVIAPDADIDHAAGAIMRGKLLNAGQTCVAPDYVLVPAELKDRFVAAAIRAARTLFPAPEGPDYSAVRDAAARERLEGLAAAETVVPLFEIALASPKIAPALVLEPRLDGALMREEIFGPLLPLLSYRSLDDAVQVIADRPKPLALYWFGRDRWHLNSLLDRTASGTVAVNEAVLHAAIEALPFGGIGASGMGAYHGRAGFDTFTHTRPVFIQSRWSPSRLLRPPYGPRQEQLLRFLLK